MDECLFCSGRGRFPAHGAGGPVVCRHCGGSGRGGLDRELRRRLPVYALLLICLLAPPFVVLAFVTRDTGSLDMFVKAAGGFAVLLAFYAILGRVVHDTAALLLVAAVGLGAAWWWVNRTNLPYAALTVACTLTVGAVVFVAFRPTPIAGTRDRRGALLTFLVIGAGVLATSGSGGAILAGLLVAAAVAHWALGNVTLRRAGEKKGS